MFFVLLDCKSIWSAHDNPVSNRSVTDNLEGRKIYPAASKAVNLEALRQDGHTSLGNVRSPPDRKIDGSPMYGCMHMLQCSPDESAVESADFNEISGCGVGIKVEISAAPHQDLASILGTALCTSWARNVILHGPRAMIVTS